MQVRIPARDTPSPLGLISIGLAGLALGIAAAWWAKDDRAEQAAVGERAPRPSVEPAPPPPEPSEPEPPSAPALRVVRGRVAYLRCEPATCPRDEAMEAAVWTAIEALPACADPPSEAGEADIRLDFVADAAPILEWRDTFPDETVRLDRERVLECLREPLAAARKSVPAQRLLVSFRFVANATP